MSCLPQRRGISLFCARCGVRWPCLRVQQAIVRRMFQSRV